MLFQYYCCRPLSGQPGAPAPVPSQFDWRRKTMEALDQEINQEKLRFEEHLTAQGFLKAAAAIRNPEELMRPLLARQIKLFEEGHPLRLPEHGGLDQDGPLSALDTPGGYLELEEFGSEAGRDLGRKL